MLAAMNGFHVQKHIQFGVTNLCSNEQLAEEIAVSLHFLKLLFCLRVCRSEVTMFFLVALWIEIFVSISTTLTYFEYCSFLEPTNVCLNIKSMFLMGLVQA